jgi:uncharacterized surface protein with fasciclin (FAS1) repeats
MMTLKALVRTLTVVFTVLAFGAGSLAAADNIVEVATAAGLTTLLDLVIKADLAGALTNGGSNLTVFAPTNEAFAALPPVLLTLLSQDFNKYLLQQILLYHVLGDRYPSSAVTTWVGGNSPPTLQGSTIKVSQSGSNLYLNSISQILAVDVPFTNGNKASVVHVISAVLVPPGFAIPSTITDLVTQLSNSGQFTLLLQALSQFGDTFTSILSSYRPNGFTVFAPTDAALRQLPARFRQFPLRPKCKKVLEKILKYHVATRVFTSDDLRDNTRVKTLAGKRINVERKANGVFVDDVKITKADIRASNGIIHAINEVLIYWD